MQRHVLRVRQAEDLRAGVVAAVIANTARDPKRRPRAYTPRDFFDLDLVLGPPPELTREYFALPEVRAAISDSAERLRALRRNEWQPSSAP